LIIPPVIRGWIRGRGILARGWGRGIGAGGLRLAGILRRPAAQLRGRAAQSTTHEGADHSPAPAVVVIYQRPGAGAESAADAGARVGVRAEAGAAGHQDGQQDDSKPRFYVFHEKFSFVAFFIFILCKLLANIYYKLSLWFHSIYIHKALNIV
jgi:hypothetical protein